VVEASPKKTVTKETTVEEVSTEESESAAKDSNI
jgi:hypothetical protein